jgi:cytidylate kinase
MNKTYHLWASGNIEGRIGAYVRAWQTARSSGHPIPLARDPFVTLSREFGCEAVPTATRLVEILNERSHPTLPWVVYDREVLDQVARELHLQREIVESMDDTRRGEMAELFDALLNRKVDEALMFRKLAEVVRSLASHGHSVIVGRGGYLITHDLKTGLHVRLVAPHEWRVHKVAVEGNLTVRNAEKIVAEGERRRANFMRTFFAQDPLRPFPYDLTLDNSRFDPGQIAETIFTTLTARFGEKPLAA